MWSYYKALFTILDLQFSLIEIFASSAKQNSRLYKHENAIKFLNFTGLTNQHMDVHHGDAVDVYVHTHWWVPGS